MREEWVRPPESQDALDALRQHERQAMASAAAWQVQAEILTAQVRELSAEVLALREALGEAVDWIDPWCYEAEEAAKKARAILARSLPDAVKRVEVEARLGRVYAAWMNAVPADVGKEEMERLRLAVVEARDALHALEGGEGA